MRMERSLRKTSWGHYRRNKTSGKNSLKASIPEFSQVTFTHIFTPSVSMHLTEPVCR